MSGNALNEDKGPEGVRAWGRMITQKKMEEVGDLPET